MDPFSHNAENVLQPETPLISSIKSISSKLDISVLREKYEVLGLSTQQIADELASSRTGVLSALRRAGIKVRAKSQAHGNPANPPYGMRVINGKLAECPEEQKVIDLIWRLANNDGLSSRAIARTLSGMGIEKRRGGTHWHHEHVGAILKRLSKARKAKEAVNPAKKRASSQKVHLKQGDGK